MKPGYRTSEFWLAAIAALVGLLLASGIIPVDSGIERALAALGSGLAAMGYSLGRGVAKASDLGK